MFLLFTLGRPDIFAPADLGLRKALQRLWSLPDLPSPDAAEQLTQRWQPYRSYASLHLWWSIDGGAKPVVRPDNRLTVGLEK